MKALRADLVFSYWIYLWFILYYLNITTFNPKLAIILGVIDNAIMLFLMMIFGTSNRTIMYFIIINTLIKIIPLYYLRNKAINLSDIYFTFILFLIFIIWLHINSQSLVGNIKLVYESLLYGKNKTPFMDFLQKIKNNYKSLEIL